MGGELSLDYYANMPAFETISYCENDGCEKFCTDSTYPTAVSAELNEINMCFCNTCANNEDGYCHECDANIEYIDTENGCLCYIELVD